MVRTFERLLLAIKNFTFNKPYEFSCFTRKIDWEYSDKTILLIHKSRKFWLIFLILFGIDTLTGRASERSEARARTRGLSHTATVQLATNPHSINCYQLYYFLPDGVDCEPLAHTPINNLLFFQLRSYKIHHRATHTNVSRSRSFSSV